MIRASSIRAFWKARSRLEQAVFVLILAVLLLEASGGKPATLVGLLEFVTVMAGSALAIRYLRMALRPLMWRLRHRLLITYIFIGVVPVLLLLAMAGLAGYLFYGQVATYLVDDELGEVGDALRLAARAAAREGSGANAEEVIRAHLPLRLTGLPVQVAVLPTRPEWFKDSYFQGLVATGEGHALRAAVSSGAGITMVSAPLNSQFLGRLVAGIGMVRSLVPAVSEPAAGRTPTRLQVGSDTYDPTRGVDAGMLAPPEHRFDVAVRGVLTVPVIDWESGKRRPAAVLAVTSRPSIMNARLFSTLGDYPLTALAGVAIAFLVIEVFSLWIGIRLTRSMTRAVADLYEGTERIHSGDFSARVPVRSSDQLAALAESFNTMSASLEELIREQKEKQRLLSELDIARDVQARLFPKEVPSLGGLELAGLCNPARSVSGDYYDFQLLDDRYLALAIGDIAGKGISAALLMASIQSMLHAQLYYLARSPSRTRVAAAGDGHQQGDGDFATAAVVAQLNRQLQRNIAPGHFATFCFAMYDDATGGLTYTNAGHLAPVILRHGQILRLHAGGTVLGIFPAAQYEQETIRLERGDVLVAFTDGITEPENLYGEEFGEARLLEILRRTRDRAPAEIAAAVMAAVNDWTNSPEQQDDMTLLVARRR